MNYFHNSSNIHNVSMRNKQETLGKIPYWFHNVISEIELAVIQSLNLYWK